MPLKHPLRICAGDTVFENFAERGDPAVNVSLDAWKDLGSEPRIFEAGFPKPL